jgi:hypothetical protein
LTAGIKVNSRVVICQLDELRGAAIFADVPEQHQPVIGRLRANLRERK